MSFFSEVGKIASGGSVANRLLGTEKAAKNASKAEAQAYRRNDFQKLMFKTFQDEAVPLQALRDEYLGYYKSLAGGGEAGFREGPEYSNVVRAGSDIANRIDTRAPESLQNTLLDRAKNLGLGEYQNYYGRIATGGDVSSRGLNSTNRLLGQNLNSQSQLLGASADQISGFLNDQASKQRDASSSIVGGLFAAFCDERLKENVVKITDGELPVYRFNYIGDDDIYEGHMAQDILKVDPDHVIEHESGYLMVSYKYKPKRVA